MKYVVTKDCMIHQVTDEEIFFKTFPDAQDITHIWGVHEAWVRQEGCKKIRPYQEIIDKLKASKVTYDAAKNFGNSGLANESNAEIQILNWVLIK